MLNINARDIEKTVLEVFVFLCLFPHLKAQTVNTVILCQFMVCVVLCHVLTLDDCGTEGVTCPFSFNDVLCRYSPSICKILKTEGEEWGWILLKFCIPSHSMVAFTLHMKLWYHSRIVLMISCDSFILIHVQCDGTKAVDFPTLFLRLQFSEDTCQYTEHKGQGLSPLHKLRS